MSERRKTGITQPPPGASMHMHRVALRVRSPVEAFLHMEVSGGLVLLLMAVVALAWANVDWDSYHGLFAAPISISIGEHTVALDLHFLINEGLMTFFFLVAGLEIKRELVDGELSDFRRASLPVAAAVGGMVVPALIYFSLNREPPASAGWGVPMATDIAFAVGILSLLGRRIPAAMRILLLALAIIDDLGAIVVIAVFYSSGVQLSGLGVVVGGFAVTLFFLRIGIRPGAPYLFPMAIMWAGLLIAGVHPTLSGVILGLAIPVRPWLTENDFAELTGEAVREFNHLSSHGADHQLLLRPVKRLSFAGREALSPVVRLQAELHGWVAFGIMPVFALANAGVNLGGVSFDSPHATAVLVGVSAGLALGKPIGVLLASWLCVRLGLGQLPKGLNWTGITIVGLAAGIGFTMAIFIAELAFAGSPEILSLAKLAILIGTGAAAVIGIAIGFVRLKPVSPDIARLTPADVEKSTEY